MNNFLIKNLAKIVSPVIEYSGIRKITKGIYGGNGHILMLHRVLPSLKENRIHNHQSLEITTEHLEKLIQFYKKNLYNIISLDDLYEGLTNSNLPKKFVVFTLDDGYSDNYNYAFPIFKKNDIPFTIYITICFPNNCILLWWYALEDLLLKNDTLKHKDYPFLDRISCKTLYQKEMAFYEIRTEMLKMDKQELGSFFKTFNIDLHSYVKDMALKWDQIIKLSRDPLVTIGAHTVNHLSLANLSKEDCYTEIMKSKLEIESKIGKTVKHFCYPFGKAGQVGTREFNMARDIGFLTGTTTRLANIFPAHKNFIHALPRISVNSKTSEYILKANIDGVFPMVRNKFKRVVSI